MHPDDRLDDVAKRMLDQHTSHAVVVEPRTDRPVGVLSTLDIAGILGWGRGLTAALPPGPAPLVLAGADAVAQTAAELIANRLRARPRLRMLLPTGRTPLGVYAALRAHAARGELPSGAATVFQLDEYRGLGRRRRAQLRRLPASASSPASRSARSTVSTARPRTRPPSATATSGGSTRRPIDLAVLGLGHDGHVAFDEPGSSLESGTRVVALHPQTRADAAEEFGGLDHVPTHALTVGLRTLLAARELLMLVDGRGQGRGAAVDARSRRPAAASRPRCCARTRGSP